MSRRRRGSGIPAGGPGQGPPSGLPATGRQPEPYRPGNASALRHGARSARFVDPVAAELVAALLADRPDLAAWPEAVAAWSRAEARCLLYAEHHAERGYLDPETGVPRGGGHVQAAENTAARLRERLGLDPLAD